MCGRYYVDDDTAREIEKLVREVGAKFHEGLKTNDIVPACTSPEMLLRARDIHPSETAPVIAVSGRELCCRPQKWGFPGSSGKQLIFNARSESALEKKMFRESVAKRRIVVPAAGFYEWNRQKEKNTFFRKGQPLLYMAGFYNRYQDEDRFVILTTKANASMSRIHDRMPLILEKEEISDWLLKEEAVADFLAKEPPQLQRRADYEQLNLFSQENTTG